MKILVVNAGSSSLKYQLFDMETGEVLAKGLCERIGIDGKITHKRPGKEDYVKEVDLKDHKSAIELVLSVLTDSELGVVAARSSVSPLFLERRSLNISRALSRSTPFTARLLSVASRAARQ